MMSASSFNKVDKGCQNCSSLQDEKVNKALKPEWLQSFLGETFFGPCEIHPLHKNELSKYCIECEEQICQYCACDATHRQHKTLRIYRYSYKDAVSLDAMENHIDCSQIQPYRSNDKWIIVLKPLPRSSSTKRSEASSCDICKRKLGDPNLYRYCSISCKVQAVLRKPNDSAPPFISLETVAEEEVAEEETAGSSLPIPGPPIPKKKRTPRVPVY